MELVSPSSAGWDTVTKRQAYAESGIPHYWMVDTRKGHERFTALRLPQDGSDYEIAYDSDTEIDVDDPIPVSAPLADLFAPTR